MKTEFEIAKYFLDMRERESEGSDRWLFWNKCCNVHNDSCQRWWEFLEAEHNVFDRMSLDTFSVLYKVRKRMYNKITDLKNTIKLYSENGI